MGIPIPFMPRSPRPRMGAISDNGDLGIFFAGGAFAVVIDDLVHVFDLVEGDIETVGVIDGCNRGVDVREFLAAFPTVGV